ncbi:DUF3307 domain-containing protein [Maribacter hydrothermalis]|uniref:DUF3307 domain-containing protein n=1 Tax=Maribacter hydrothermalis TaxID=1836467 RepID=A0A1B7Z7U7_9FLAO|nr:DUF3307 domain-containing protein [Maribacter hydrothermalis]APQ15852.1 hypothetical protein BTR34_00185 [Maribacter hydrothermalis]OBR38769.1 hypothetical protein A9200_03625 [Maribacter hydrothermalis]
MLLFIKLILAHLIGDFILQPNKWVVHKQSNKITSKYLYLHVLLHFGLYLVILWDFSFWRIALIITVSHLIIDILKLYSDSLFRNKSIPFFIDQGLHIIIIYCCVFYANLYDHTLSLFKNLDWYLVTAIVFVTYPAAIIMGKILEGMSNQIETDHKSLPNAGKYIGIIERLFVLIFIVIGRWEVIGLLIAAKSVFRFNDLKERNNRKLTEYILIGTLVSFGLAILAGLLYIN